MIKKHYKIGCEEPKGELQSNFVLLPIGYIFNADLLNCQRGDTITFVDGGKYRVIYAKKMPIDELSASLCIMRYGFSIDYWLELWKEMVKYGGNNKNAISDSECLLIIYGKEKINSHNREIARI